MRLTLRTLLAYLDDMLDPAETKAIGQKVAESDAARELIDRIKQVTRRRRLTTPPATGPGAFEPNTVADYLDNTLTSEQVADVEKACLESDVHLAEIAAVHQILTLIEGQPALVPPTAKERMYGLVSGREAIPSRRAPAARRLPDGHENDADEDDVPLFGRPGAWVRWLVPLAAVALLAVIAVILWQALPGRSPVVAERPPENKGTPVEPAPQPPVETKPGTTPDTKPATPPETKPAETTAPGSSEATAPPTSSARPTRPEAPSKERRDVGRYVTQVGGTPNVLVSRPASDQPWQRLVNGGKVQSADALVSLPGYRSEVRLGSGVYVTLWGSLPELARAPLMESAAVLHVPAAGLDADLTLDRGALMIANRKDKETEPARVRVRFHDEVWDLTLTGPDASVGLTLWGRHVAPYGSGEGPQAELFLFVLGGQATVKVRFVEHRDLESTPVPTMLYWDNKGRGVQGPTPARGEQIESLLAVWGKPANSTRELRAALDGLSQRLSTPQPIETALAEVVQPTDGGQPFHRLLAVRCLAALDDVPDVLNVLEDDRSPPEVRVEAIHALRHWIGRGDDQERRLYDAKQRSGILLDKKFRPAEAEMILTLLHTFGSQQVAAPETYGWLIDNLRHERLALRELAYWHLSRLAPAGRAIAYNPADGVEQRDRAYEQWKKLIPEGKLPPPPK